MRPELIEALRADLAAADYRALRVRELLGEEADEARLRGVLAPARRVLREREPSALSTLIRVLLLGDRIDEAGIRSALPALGAEGALELGLLALGDEGCRASLSLNPVRIDDAESPEAAEWWILSDLDDHLRVGPAKHDHVMGVGGATRSLIAQLPPGEASRSLDLGTGCGVVALHLALRGGAVVATDISARALGLARANARLNGIAGIDFRLGSLFEPVAGERFDLIASNPPFVVTPRSGDGSGEEPRYDYRDGGMIGDALAERVVLEAPAHLAEGGTLVCLANWESHWGIDGLARVRAWIEDARGSLGAEGGGTGLAAWAVERERLTPVRYAETWARDGGARPGEAGFDRLVETWLDDFAARRVVSLGLGSIRLRRCAVAGERAVRVERAAGAFGARPGAELAEAFDAAILTAGLGDEEILARRWLLSDGVTEIREHRPGEESPRAIALESARGIARRVSADPLLAAAVGACDGDLSLGRLADALAILLEVDRDAAASALVEGARELVWLGMLVPEGR